MDFSLPFGASWPTEVGKPRGDAVLLNDDDFSNA